jgi:diguanylate cyclase (GGDEF)-like protein
MRVNSEIEAHLRSLVNFPSPPGVAAHIIELARDPEIELAKVARTLSLDSALSAKVLRIANSPLYAQRRKSESLRQALVVLGLNATLTLALSFSLVKCLRGAKSNGINHPLYWRRALLAATSARALADAMHHPCPEEIFLAALLQDVGILALDQAMPDLYRGGDRLQIHHAALAQVEAKRLQADHAAIGGWLMRSWSLPERLNVAIEHSHLIDPSFTDDPAEIFRRCVSLSGPIADLFLLSQEQRPFAETAQSAERSLGLERTAFGQVLATVGAMIPETEAIFESESLAAQHPELILEQAREVLMLRSVNALNELNSLRSVVDRAGSKALEVEEESRRDPLTGVYNRAHFEHVLLREFENSTRNDWPLSIAFANLDRLESIKDKYGLEAREHMLQAAARILRDNTREHDLIARCGEEEFAVILPSTDTATARAVCERIVAAFGTADDALGAHPAEFSASIGSATHGGEIFFASAHEFVEAAEQALRAAGKRGHSHSACFGRQIAAPNPARTG